MTLVGSASVADSSFLYDSATSRDLAVAADASARIDSASFESNDM